MEPIRIEQLNKFNFNDSTQDENYVTKIYVVVNSDIHNYIEFLRNKINEKIEVTSKYKKMEVKFQSEQNALEDKLTTKENECADEKKTLEERFNALQAEHSALQQRLVDKTELEYENNIFRNLKPNYEYYKEIINNLKKEYQE